MEVEFICSGDDVLDPKTSEKLTCENGKWNKKIPWCKGSKIFPRKCNICRCTDIFTEITLKICLKMKLSVVLSAQVNGFR